MRFLFLLAIVIPCLATAQSQRGAEDALDSATAMLRRAVENEPDEDQFQRMLAKAQQVRLEHPGDTSTCREGAAAYVNGGNTIKICDAFYRNQHAGRYFILHELAHLTAQFSFTFGRRPDGECMADYWAYRVHDAVGAPIGPSGYDQRCGGSSRNWRP